MVDTPQAACYETFQPYKKVQKKSQTFQKNSQNDKDL